MTRRGIAVVCLLLALTVPAVVSAATPEGPRLAFMRWKLEGSKLQLVTSDSNGVDQRPLAGGGGDLIRPLPYPYNQPAWSPDGSRIVFTGIKGSLDASPLRTALFSVSAEGGKPQAIPGARGGFYPTFSPDGATIAFARGRLRTRENRRGAEVTTYESISTWLVDLASGKSRQLTPWRDRLLNVPSSFAPDNKTLVVSRLVGDKPPEVIGLSFDGSADSVLVRNALEGAYSPDGTRLAFGRGPIRKIEHDGESEEIRLTDLFVVNASGGGLKRLTDTPRATESAPSWDPSSQRLAYTRMKPFGGLLGLFGFGDAIMQVNADGSCPIKAMSFDGALLYGAAWQPGPGREAGPIAC